MSAALQSYISDFLKRRGLKDQDGFSVRAADALDRVAEPTKDSMTLSLSRVKTNLFRRHPSIRKQNLLDDLASRILKGNLVPMKLRSSSKCQILCLAANPLNTSRLQIDEEIRTIQAKIRESEHRDILEFEPMLAVRADDLLRAVNERKPTIIHFAGHGGTVGGIDLAADAEESHSIAAPALAKVLALFRPKPKLVFLNACYSSTLSHEILKEVDAVVGMGAAITDSTAILFAGVFYRAIGFGRSIQGAYDQGIVALELDGGGEVGVPRLVCRQGVDPKRMVLCEGSI